jgi:DNA adenine methylase
MTTLPWFSRVGGKRYSCQRIISYFPDHHDIQVYVEPFVGSGRVMLSLEKYPTEVVNDKDRNVFHLWKDMQDISHAEISKMDFTPRRERFLQLKNENFISVKERLERNLYLNLWSYGRNMIGYAVPEGHYTDFKNKLLKRLPMIQSRIKDVVVLNTDWKHVVEKYDGPDTLTYLDPPYHETIQYGLEAIDPKEVKECLSRLKGKWALSYNDHPHIRSLFSSYRIIEIKTRRSFTRKNAIMNDLLILNY